MDRVEFIEALKLIEKEKGIDREIIFEAIEASLEEKFRERTEH